MQELVEVARALIKKRFVEDRHHVAAALRAKSGQIYSAVHVECYIGRVTVCAEAVAIGMAATAGESEVIEIVAVDRNGNVVSPCGMCREMIADYGRNANVGISQDGNVIAIPVGELLPLKYSRL